MPPKPLALASASQRAPAVVRVEFTSAPKAASPAQLDGALNPSNWALGPGLAAAREVREVSGYPKKFDLFCSAPLAPGPWEVSVANVRSPLGAELSPPTAVAFRATPPSGYAGFTAADTPSEADALRSFLNPALRGSNYDGFVQAVGAGEQRNRDDAAAGYAQLFVPTASGSYLTSLGASRLVDRPKNAGMRDADFASLIEAQGAGKISEGALRAALEPFYGAEFSRAVADSAPEPYALFGGEDLTLSLDERLEVSVQFAASDFSVPGAVPAAEIAAALSRALSAAATGSWAAPRKSPSDGLTRTRIYGRSLGPRSSIRITGGSAQGALVFPAPLPLLNGGLPTWDVVPDPSDGTCSYASAGASGLDLSGLRPGDYVNVFGAEFAASNRGSFPVSSVSVSYPGGTLLQSFVVANRAAASQAGLAQASASSVLYFRPEARRASEGASVVSRGDGSMAATLLATAATVSRAPGAAAYLRAARTLEATSVRRTGSVATVSSAAHGLSVGSQAIVDGAYSDGAPPATVAGSAPVLDASSVSIWADTPPPEKLVDHAALKLGDGRAFVVAGSNGSSNTVACRLFTLSGPTVLPGGQGQYSGSWANAAPYPPATAHALVQVTLLPDGRVFASGGASAAGASFADTYLYSPAPPAGAGSWSAGPTMTGARADHRQVLLANGKVLIAGGFDSSNNSLATCEIFDPSDGSVTATGPMAFARQAQILVAAANGDAVAIGGFSSTFMGGSQLYQCEVYDAGSGTWKPTGSMSYAREGAAFARLPDGRVIVGGGVGIEASNSNSDTSTCCEVYDPSTGRWGRGPKMLSGRVSGAYVSTGASVYAMGGAAGDDDLTEYLDASFVWRRSPAAIFGGRVGAKAVPLADGVVLLSGGEPNVGSWTALDRVFVPASEVIGAGGLNGMVRVASVPDPDTFTYAAPGGYTSAPRAGAVAMAALPALPGVPGAHVWNPDGTSPALTSVRTFLTSPITAGVGQGTYSVADASSFPDAPGWLCIGLGRSYQSSPVRYLGKTGLGILTADFVPLARSAPVGAEVVLLASKGAFVPADPQGAGSFYVTDAPAARAGAQAVLEASAPAGAEFDLTVEYPGDRGLGNEGSPDSGVPKISEAVEIWAEDPDSETAAARGS